MSNYFSRLPDFDYVSRLPDAKISDYIRVKNLFKKGELRQDIFQDVAFFTKYTIQGDDRPDNVASKFYGNSRLDWLVLTCNNIVNIQSEWPLTNNEFDSLLVDKYGSYEAFNQIHHYETTELRNTENVIVVPAGLKVEKDFKVDYFDFYANAYLIATPVKEVTNYDYELKIEESKRNIFLLKTRYLAIVEDDLLSLIHISEPTRPY